jgi:hypothetical protein
MVSRINDTPIIWDYDSDLVKLFEQAAAHLRAQFERFGNYSGELSELVQALIMYRHALFRLPKGQEWETALNQQRLITQDPLDSYLIPLLHEYVEVLKPSDETLAYTFSGCVSMASSRWALLEQFCSAPRHDDIKLRLFLSSVDERPRHPEELQGKERALFIEIVTKKTFSDTLRQQLSERCTAPFFELIQTKAFLRNVPSEISRKYLDCLIKVLRGESSLTLSALNPKDLRAVFMFLLYATAQEEQTLQLLFDALPYCIGQFEAMGTEALSSSLEGSDEEVVKSLLERLEQLSLEARTDTPSLPGVMLQMVRRVVANQIEEPLVCLQSSLHTFIRLSKPSAKELAATICACSIFAEEITTLDGIFSHHLFLRLITQDMDSEFVLNLLFYLLHPQEKFPSNYAWMLSLEPALVNHPSFHEKARDAIVRCLIDQNSTESLLLAAKLSKPFTQAHIILDKLATILDSAVQDAKAMQDLESKSLLMGAEHSQTVKAAPIKSDYGSRDCVDLASSTAESRIIEALTGEHVAIVQSLFASTWTNTSLGSSVDADALSFLATFASVCKRLGIQEMITPTECQAKIQTMVISSLRQRRSPSPPPTLRSSILKLNSSEEEKWQ